MKDFIIDLVQYTFISANNGACRTYRKIIDQKKVGIPLVIGQKLNPTEVDYLIP